MPNPVTATTTPIVLEALRPPASGSRDSNSGFAPLFTRPVELAITAVDDELGRPLVGLFVPDGELL